MNLIQIVRHGAADWNPVRKGVKAMICGMVLCALGVVLAVCAYGEYAAHWSLHGSARPGNEILGLLAVLGGSLTLIGGPLLTVVGVFLLAGLPTAPGTRRWASWGVVSVPAFLLMMVLVGWAGHQMTAPQNQVDSGQVQPAPSPDASLWDSVVGPANGQAPPPAPAPPLTKPAQVWGMDVQVILTYASILVLSGALFFWTLCITRLLRATAQNWEDQSLSRWFLTFFISAWCVIAIWGFCYFDSTVLERIAQNCFPGHTGNEILFTSAPVILLGLFGWQVVLLRKLMRHLKLATH